jgi:hypothetical protein
MGAGWRGSIQFIDDANMAQTFPAHHESALKDLAILAR